MIDVRQIRYFAKVVEAGSLSRAAEELHVSQPALSLQIQNLEQEFEIKLLVRGPRGAVPTAAGLYLYNRSIEILSALEETCRELRGFNKSDRERITIGVTPSIGRQLGANLLLDAHRIMPNLFLRVIEGFSVPLREAACRGELDFGFMYDIERHPSLEIAELLREHFALITRNDGKKAKERSIALRHVLKHKLVFQSDHKAVHQALREAAQRHAISLDIALETQSVEAICDIVERGLAAAVLPYGIMAEAVRTGRVNARRIVEPNLSRTLYLVRSRKSRFSSPADHDIAAFVTAVRKGLIRSLGEYCEPL